MFETPSETARDWLKQSGYKLSKSNLQRATDYFEATRSREASAWNQEHGALSQGLEEEDAPKEEKFADRIPGEDGKVTRTELPGSGSGVRGGSGTGSRPRSQAQTRNGQGSRKDRGNGAEKIDAELGTGASKAIPADQPLPQNVEDQPDNLDALIQTILTGGAVGAGYGLAGRRGAGGKSPASASAPGGPSGVPAVANGQGGLPAQVSTPLGPASAAGGPIDVEGYEVKPLGGPGQQPQLPPPQAGGPPSPPSTATGQLPASTQAGGSDPLVAKALGIDATPQMPQVGAPSPQLAGPGQDALVGEILGPEPARAAPVSGNLGPPTIEGTAIDITPTLPPQQASQLPPGSSQQALPAPQGQIGTDVPQPGQLGQAQGTQWEMDQFAVQRLPKMATGNPQVPEVHVGDNGRIYDTRTLQPIDDPALELMVVNRIKQLRNLSQNARRLGMFGR